MLFFVTLAGTAILIFLLSLLQHGIEGDVSKDAGNAGEEQRASNEQDRNINETGHGLVADAIHTYRRGRETDEYARAKRERVTIIALVATAVFALFAAGAAGISAWFFYGQLGEMHQASLDTAALARTARDTEERQLRAYISIESAAVLLTGRALQGTVDIRNSGRTPAYDLTTRVRMQTAPAGEFIAAPLQIVEMVFLSS